MAKQQSQKKSGGSKKIGRNADKCKKYFAFHTREKNKIKRVLQSNGRAYAETWAKAHNVSSLLAKL
jgi:hypothetical protein